VATAEALADTLCQQIAAPIVVQDARLVVGVSLGVGPLPDAGSDQPTGESLRRADVALYRAKSTGCGVAIWDASLDVGLEERLRLVAELRAALSGDEILAYFQPQADARTGEVVSFEALVRWQHPRRGLLLPGAFLETAESAGLLPSITQLMLSQSLAALRSATAAERAISVAVNIGAGDLLDDQLPDKVQQLLTDHRVAPERLVIEVTESVVMTDPDRMVAVLDRLRRMGVRIALDDYGTGLASLRYLRTLPLDELKIDRSLVADLDGESSSALIVASTIQLAHGLGLHVVVEGVERPAAAALLASMGCDALQGWLVGYPLPRESLTAAGPATGVPDQTGGAEREPAGRV
jgi:EAL domain-containing protein (putative c-di-GMP-specific phosphodiesterase class I)